MKLESLSWSLYYYETIFRITEKYLPQRLDSAKKIFQTQQNKKSFDFKILGVTHWNDTVENAFEQKGYVIVDFARKDGMKRQGVAIITEKEFSKSMISYEQTSGIVISVNLDTNIEPVTIN